MHWKKFKNNLDYQEFSSFCRRIRTSIKKDFKCYINKVESGVANVKSFCSFMSNRCRYKSTPKSIQSSSDDSIANAFSEHFKSVFEPCNSRSDIYPRDSNSAIIINNISIDDIKNQINKLDIHKGSGPDGLPPIFIKWCLN